MYLQNIKIFNFRKFGIRQGSTQVILPGIDLTLNEHLNLLVGENDSGKTAIIDAVKFVVGTQSNDWVKLFPEDFHVSKASGRSVQLKIECTFCGFSSNEAGAFLEWLNIDDNQVYTLELTLQARLTQKSIVTGNVLYDIKAGRGDEASILPAEARERLKAKAPQLSLRGLVGCTGLPPTLPGPPVIQPTARPLPKAPHPACAGSGFFVHPH